MLTAYTMALPSSALPPAESTVAVVGAEVFLVVLLAAFAVVTGAIVERAFAPRRWRRAVRLVDGPAGGASSRRAAWAPGSNFFS